MPSWLAVADIGFATLNRQTVKSLKSSERVAVSLRRGVRFYRPGIISRRKPLKYSVSGIAGKTG